MNVILYDFKSFVWLTLYNVGHCYDERSIFQCGLSCHFVTVKGSSRMFYNLCLHFIDTTVSTYMLLDVISTSTRIRMKMVYIQGDKSYNTQ